MQSQTLSSYAPVSELSAEARSNFIWRTYGHVAAAILLFAGIETYLFDSGLAGTIAAPMVGNWLLVLGAFMIVSWIATHVAHTVQAKAVQYVALVGFVVAEAIIFVPLLAFAMAKAPGVIESAAGVTLLGTGGGAAGGAGGACANSGAAAVNNTQKPTAAAWQRFDSARMWFAPVKQFSRF